eukprot:929909-Karenia_brevis.AAC.1
MGMTELKRFAATFRQLLHEEWFRYLSVANLQERAASQHCNKGIALYLPGTQQGQVQNQGRIRANTDISIE